MTNLFLKRLQEKNLEKVEKNFSVFKNQVGERCWLCGRRLAKKQCKQICQAPHVQEYCQTCLDARTVKLISIKRCIKVPSDQVRIQGNKDSIKSIHVAMELKEEAKELSKEFDNVQDPKDSGTKDSHRRS